MMKIEDIVATYGAKNIRIFMEMQASTSLHGMGLPLAMKDSNAPYEVIECQIDEERYKVSDGYKITLAPVNQRTERRFVYCSESYYQTDFNNMRRRRPDDFRIYILVDEDGKYERLREDIRQAA